MTLDWELACERLQQDVRDDFFPDPLDHADVIDAARKDIDSVISRAAYVPEPAENWDAPKSNFTLRHCVNICSVDRLVYQALVDSVAVICDSQLLDCCYAYPFRGRRRLRVGCWEGRRAQRC